MFALRKVRVSSVCDRRVLPKIVDERFQIPYALKRTVTGIESGDHEREKGSGLIRHSDRGSQYVSIVYNERSRMLVSRHRQERLGDSYDNALAKKVSSSYQERVDSQSHMERRGRH